MTIVHYNEKIIMRDVKKEMKIIEKSLSITDQKQLNEVIKIIKDEIGESLIGLYLYGSATQEGLKINSDIDMLSVTSKSISQRKKSILAKKIMKIFRKINDSNDLRYVELTNVVINDIIPWKHPVYQDFIYGEWLRSEYQKGDFGKREKNPDVTILLYQVKQKGISLLSNKFELPSIPFQDVKLAMREMVPIISGEIIGDESNSILTLCRILYTLESKEIVSKDIAATKVKAKFNLKHQKVIESAINEYLTGKAITSSTENILETIHVIQESINQLN